VVQTMTARLTLNLPSVSAHVTKKSRLLHT
jgi:hypothetical protein